MPSPVTCCTLAPPSPTTATTATMCRRSRAGSPSDFSIDVHFHFRRNLYDLNFAEFSFSKQSLLRIDVKYRDHFLVDYVHGFNSSTHVYFVTVQKKSYLPGCSPPPFLPSSFSFPFPRRSGGWLHHSYFPFLYQRCQL